MFKGFILKVLLFLINVFDWFINQPLINYMTCLNASFFRHFAFKCFKDIHFSTRNQQVPFPQSTQYYLIFKNHDINI